MNDFDELKQIQDEYNKLSASDRKAKLDALKGELGKLASELKSLEEQKNLLEIQVKDINISIKEKTTAIRRLWAPFIAGAEKASIDCDGIVLKTEPSLQISVLDEEEARQQAIQWLQENGYEGALKWDLHTSTLKKIAREHYEGEGFSIPGLKYNYFQKITVK